MSNSRLSMIRSAVLIEAHGLLDFSAVHDGPGRGGAVVKIVGILLARGVEEGLSQLITGPFGK